MRFGVRKLSGRRSETIKPKGSDGGRVKNGKCPFEVTMPELKKRISRFGVGVFLNSVENASFEKKRAIRIRSSIDFSHRKEKKISCMDSSHPVQHLV